MAKFICLLTTVTSSIIKIGHSANYVNQGGTNDGYVFIIEVLTAYENVSHN